MSLGRFGRSAARRAGQVTGNAVHEASQCHDAHKHQQDRAHLHSVAYHPLVALEKAQHRPGKQSHGQEGDHKAEGVYRNQQEAAGGAARRRGHQQNAAQRGAHAGRPRKAEGKAKHQGHQRVHSPPVQPEGQPVLPLQGARAPEHAELVQAKQDHNDAADAGKPGLVAAEKASQCCKAEPQQEKGKADAHHKEQGVDQYPSPGIADIAVAVHVPGASRQIADVEGHKGQHTGREKAQQPL